MEIEAKFRVGNPAIFTALLQLATIGPFDLEPATKVEEQHNTYFDTADQRLRAQRYGLRVRDLGTRRIATLKGAGSVQGELHERDEWEVEVDNDNQPEHWPASEVRARVLALTGGAPLQAMLTSHTKRQNIYVRRGDVSIAELSLDEGWLSAGGKEAAFRELEIELKDDGSRADFNQLVTLLRERFALVPEERSKLARGLALLDDTDRATSPSL